MNHPALHERAASEAFSFAFSFVALASDDTY